MKGQRLDDTICAIATPMGEGGIGVVRISGPDAIALSSRVVRLRSRITLQNIRSHALHVADILMSLDCKMEKKSEWKESLLDEGMVVCMRAPRSYTGEDVVEFHCHGGPLILHTLCEELVKKGARLAEPGEFTKRAFLNGRIDLTRAEAVLDTIHATTSRSLQVAQEQLRGNLFQATERMRTELIRLVGHLEAGMDFVEEDIHFIDKKELQTSISALLRDTVHLLNSFEEGRMLREGIVTAIIGRPNVGKSSLLNALLQTDRAIVSTVPGTTRDVLEEVLNIEGIPLVLVDTAGVRDNTQDFLEEEGIRRTREAINRASLLLIIVDGSDLLTQADVDFIKEYHDKKRLVILNKSDLPCQVEGETIDEILKSSSPTGERRKSDDSWVRLSAKTGDGMDRLRKAIPSLVLESGYEPSDSVLVTRLRHKSTLQRAEEALTRAMDALEQGLSGECIALDLRIALESFGELTGTVTTDDILDQIFKEFCVGK